MLAGSTRSMEPSMVRPSMKVHFQLKHHCVPCGVPPGYVACSRADIRPNRDAAFTPNFDAFSRGGHDRARRHTGLV